MDGLRAIFTELTGFESSVIDAESSFFALGADSLLLLQAANAIRDKFGVAVSLRELFEERSTLNALAVYLDERLKVDDGPPEDNPPESPRTNQTTAVELNKPADGHDGEKAGTDLERILGRQLETMAELISRQFDLLREGWPRGERVLTSADATRFSAATGGYSEARGPHSTHEPERFGPYPPIETGAETLTQDQKKHLDQLIARFNRLTSGSKRLAQKHRPFHADPCVAAGFRLSWKEIIYPIVVRRSSGSRLWDVDNNEFVDFTMGFGVHLFGHSPGFIIEALEDQLRQGAALGPQSDAAGEAAQMICEITNQDRAAFCNSGTEAVMAALRLARSVTARSKIALFVGSYHGSFDGVLARPRNSGLDFRSIPMAPGVPPHMIEDALVLPYGAPESLDALRAHADELAAVLVEPVQSRRPDFHPKAFLQELRTLTERTGTALIMDEIITGFRVHPGGAQAWFGVQGDLATYGKVVGGGMPIGVVAGKSRFMDAIDGGTWEFGDLSAPTAPQTFFAGTFCKHPLTMAASCAVLKHLKASGPALQRQLNERTARLAAALNSHFDHCHLPVRVSHFGSLFRFNWPRHVRMMDLLSSYLIEKGVYVWEGGTRFLSTAHSESDIDFFIRAVKESIAEMEEAGFIQPNSSSSEADAQLQVLAPVHRPTTGTGPAIAIEIQSEPAEVITVPLTEGQKQIWSMAQMGQDASSAYNESLTMDLRGPFRLEAMDRAFQRIIDRHEVLRSSIGSAGNCLRIARQKTIDVAFNDFSNLKPGRREADSSDWLSTLIGEPFDLVRGPLLRVGVARLEARRHLLVLIIHHIITDGWSTGIILQELRALYAAECEAHEVRLPRPASYSEYANRRVQLRESRIWRENEAYWLDQLSGLVPSALLPSDGPKTTGASYSGACEHSSPNHALHGEIRRLSADLRSTLYITLLAGFELLLHFLTAKDDLIVGISSAGQRTSSEYLVGYFVNVLPLRSRWRDEDTFDQFLGQTKSVLLGAHEHQDYPFGKLIRKLKINREPGRSPLLSAYFNLDRQGDGSVDFHDLQATVRSNFSGRSRWDLTWNITQSDTALWLDAVYKIDLFDRDTVKGWINAYWKVLATVVANPHISLRALEAQLDAEERDLQRSKLKDIEQSDRNLLKQISRRRGS